VISEANLEDLHARFVEHPDLSSRAFEDKFRDQLAGAGPETIQLAAELLYVHFLIARNIYGATKRGIIDRVLAWSPVSPSIPETLAQVLDKGIANVGTAFNTLRPNQLAFLIEFLLSWKRLPAETRESAVEDAWKFRDVLYGVPIKGAFTQREAPCISSFPTSSEPIVPHNAKQRITDRFHDCVTDQALDVDQKLVEVRRALERSMVRRFSSMIRP